MYPYIDIENEAAYLEGRRCTFDTKEIRDDIDLMIELRKYFGGPDGFRLPKRYNYVKLGNVTKIIKRFLP